MGEGERDLMENYSFNLTRSTDPADQVDGIRCGMATADGDFEAANDDQAKELAMGFACLPGRWQGSVRRAGRFIGLNFRKESAHAASEAGK